MIVFKVSFPFPVYSDTHGVVLNDIVYYPSIVEARQDTRRHLEEMVEDKAAFETHKPDVDGFYSFAISRVTVADVSRAILCAFLNGESLRKPILVFEEVIEKLCLKPEIKADAEPVAHETQATVVLHS